MAAGERRRRGLTSRETVDGVWLAIDVGGTKLAVGLVTDAGVVERSVETPTAGAADGDALFARLAGLIDQVGMPDIGGVGIGCGGPMRWREGLVSPLNIPQWRDFPLLAAVSELFPAKPVRMHNDAIAMAAGEHWRGAGTGLASIMAVVVSTGVGGGVIADVGGRPVLLRGPTGNAGHFGHVVVDADGPACHCGGRGCLEAIARGPATVAWAVEQGWRSGAGAGGGDGKALVDSALAGDPIAIAALTRAGQALGVGLASATHLLDLDRIVVGGGLAVGAGSLLLDPARVAFRRHAVMDFAARCDIVATPFGRQAGLVGAAALVAHDSVWTLAGV